MIPRFNSSVLLGVLITVLLLSSFAPISDVGSAGTGTSYDDYAQESAPPTDQEVTIEGGATRENATLIRPGVRYRVEDLVKEGEGGVWFKVNVDSVGTTVSLYDVGCKEELIDRFEDQENKPFRVWSYDAESDCQDEVDEKWSANSSGYVYFQVQQWAPMTSDEDTTFRVERTPPSKPLFNVTRAVVVPDSVQPNESVTVQARIRYSQPGVRNPLNGTVGIFIDGSLAHTITVTPDANETLSISWAFTPTASTAGNVTVAVRSVPAGLSVTASGNGDTVSRQLTVEATDYDDDGVVTQREREFGTDPRDADTDGDGVSDGEEVRLGSNPTAVNSDSDRLRDGREFQLGTNLTVADTDADELADGRELSFGTAPRTADTDGDGIPDGAEVQRNLDPTAKDTDGDGVPDGEDTQPAPTTATPGQQESTPVGTTTGTVTGGNQQSPSGESGTSSTRNQQSARQGSGSGPGAEQGPEAKSLMGKLPTWRAAATMLTFIVIVAIVVAAVWFWDLGGA